MSERKGVPSNDSVQRPRAADANESEPAATAVDLVRPDDVDETVSASDSALKKEISKEVERRDALVWADRARLVSAVVLVLIAFSGLVGSALYGFMTFGEQLDSLLRMSPVWVADEGAGTWSVPPPHPHPELFRWLFIAKALFTGTVLGVSLALLRQAGRLFRPLWLPTAEEKKSEDVSEAGHTALVASVVAAVATLLVKKE